MPSLDRRRAKGRKEGDPFFQLPYPVIDSANFCKLSYAARALLIELGRRFNGFNNGDLCAASSTLVGRGWTSNGTITRKLRELEYYGFIVRTRQGGLNRCSLYGLGWRPIDDCHGKLDVAPTIVPIGTWKEEKPKLVGRRKS